jgi:hypothetical protein
LRDTGKASRRAQPRHASVPASILVETDARQGSYG